MQFCSEHASNRLFDKQMILRFTIFQAFARICFFFARTITDSLSSSCSGRLPVKMFRKSCVFMHVAVLGGKFCQIFSECFLVTSIDKLDARRHQIHQVLIFFQFGQQPVIRSWALGLWDSLRPDDDDAFCSYLLPSFCHIPNLTLLVP